MKLFNWNRFEKKKYDSSDSQQEADRYSKNDNVQSKEEQKKVIDMFAMEGAYRDFQKQDYDKAFKVFHGLAMHGNSEAKCVIGKMYNLGLGILRDEDKAYQWYREAAIEGHKFAQFDFGSFLRTSEKYYNPTEAVKWFKKAASQGVAIAFYNMGWANITGEGIPKNIEEALKWYIRAAEQNEDMKIKHDAELQIGYVYVDEKFGICNFKKAEKWLLKAAIAGNSDAMYLLGKEYLNEASELYNFEESEKWFLKAVEYGNNHGKIGLGILYEIEYATYEYQSRALALYKEAYNEGELQIAVKIGDMYRYGKGTQIDYEMAVMWYKRAMKIGDATAVYNLGDMYEYGYGVPKNLELAEDYHRTAEKRL